MNKEWILDSEDAEKRKKLKVKSWRLATLREEGQKGEKSWSFSKKVLENGKKTKGKGEGREMKKYFFFLCFRLQYQVAQRQRKRKKAKEEIPYLSEILERSTGCLSPFLFQIFCSPPAPSLKRKKDSENMKKAEVFIRTWNPSCCWKKIRRSPPLNEMNHLFLAVYSLSILSLFLLISLFLFIDLYIPFFFFPLFSFRSDPLLIPSVIFSFLPLEGSSHPPAQACVAYVNMNSSQ